MAESGVSAVSNNVNNQNQNESLSKNQPVHPETTEKGIECIHLTRLRPYTLPF